MAPAIGTWCALSRFDPDGILIVCDTVIGPSKFPGLKWIFLKERLSVIGLDRLIGFANLVPRNNIHLIKGAVGFGSVLGLENIPLADLIMSECTVLPGDLILCVQYLRCEGCPTGAVSCT